MGTSHEAGSPPEKMACQATWQGKRIRKCVCHVRLTTHTTAVSAYGQRVSAARKANRQGGAGESIYDVRFINNVRVAQIFRIINVC